MPTEGLGSDWRVIRAMMARSALNAQSGINRDIRFVAAGYRINEVLMKTGLAYTATDASPQLENGTTKDRGRCG
jgi:hypothetical protein